MCTTHQHTSQRQLSLRQQWHLPFNEKLTWLGRVAWTAEATQPLPLANFLLKQLRILWFPAFEEYQNQAGESIPVAQGNAIFQISGFPQPTTSLRAKERFNLRTYPPKLKRRSSLVTTETPIRSKMGSSLSPSSSCVCDENPQQVSSLWIVTIHLLLHVFCAPMNLISLLPAFPRKASDLSTRA